MRSVARGYSATAAAPDGTLLESLRRTGLRVTEQRLAVLDALRSMPHATADQLLQSLRPHYASISAQTVYTVLAALENVGLVRSLTLTGAPRRYETRVGDNHHHLLCRVCGRVQDIDCVPGAVPRLDRDGIDGFAVEGVDIVIHGVCAAHHATEPPKTREWTDD